MTRVRAPKVKKAGGWDTSRGAPGRLKTEAGETGDCLGGASLLLGPKARQTRGLEARGPTVWGKRMGFRKVFRLRNALARSL